MRNLFRVFKSSPSSYPDHTSHAEPINNTRFRRCLTLACMKILEHFQDCSNSILVLSPQICVKSGSFRDLSEARSMRFIAQHTSIPVPKIYCAFNRKGITYIVMQRIRGQMATLAWDTLSEESRGKVLLQLKEMVDEMRAIPAPDERIANVDGGSLWDCRLPSNLDRFGPFEDTQAFHSFLRNGVDKAPPGHPEIDEMISLQKQQWGRPVFTHGDLSSLNILLRGDEIVGIIDWETSGWYPPYWEYTCASQVNPRNSFWEDHLDNFLEPFPNALRMEKVRQKWWGAT